MRRLRFTAVFAVCLPAVAWGPEGHDIVARIAWEQLTPAARARVTAILGPGKTITSVASWADEVRRSRPDTAGWHFIDVPITEKHLKMTRDCPKGDCVVTEIARLRAALHNPATPPDQQREDLMFLIHFIGDMHQPLHSSDNGDRGGNSVRVVFHDRQTNLHSIWDGALLNRMPPEDQLLPELERAAACNQKKWRKGTVEQWADQNHKAAQKIVYGGLGPAPQEAPATISASYEQAADTLIKEQLEKAGVRLAAVLNSLYPR